MSSISFGHEYAHKRTLLAALADAPMTGLDDLAPLSPADVRDHAPYAGIYVLFFAYPTGTVGRRSSSIVTKDGEPAGAGSPSDPTFDHLFTWSGRRAAWYVGEAEHVGERLRAHISRLVKMTAAEQASATAQDRPERFQMKDFSCATVEVEHAWERFSFEVLAIGLLSAAANICAPGWGVRPARGGG